MNKENVEKLINQLLFEIEDKKQLREGIESTPLRVANAFSEIFDGYQQNPEDYVKLFKISLDEIIISKGIKFFSMCEHHIFPFYGTVDIAYIPTDWILGISKFVRIINCFAHRLNVQERMTSEIANFLMRSELKPKGVIVVVEAIHLCEVMRGVKQPNPTMITSSVQGIFREKIPTRSEALSLLGR